MKNFRLSLALIVWPLLMMVLSGCPVGLDYSMAEPGSEKFNKKLIGTWKFQPSDSVKDAEVMEVVLKDGGDAYTLTAIVKERGEMYSLETDNFTGYETNVDDLHVLFFKPDGEAKFYHYQYYLENDDTLLLADISLLDGGVDAVTSTESLRHQVKSSMKKPEFQTASLTFKRVK